MFCISILIIIGVAAAYFLSLVCHILFVNLLLSYSLKATISNEKKIQSN